MHFLCPSVGCLLTASVRLQASSRCLHAGLGGHAHTLPCFLCPALTATRGVELSPVFPSPVIDQHACVTAKCRCLPSNSSRGTEHAHAHTQRVGLGNREQYSTVRNAVFAIKRASLCYVVWMGYACMAPEEVLSAVGLSCCSFSGWSGCLVCACLAQCVSARHQGGTRQHQRCSLWLCTYKVLRFDYERCPCLAPLLPSSCSGERGTPPLLFTVAEVSLVVIFQLSAFIYAL